MKLSIFCIVQALCGALLAPSLLAAEPIRGSVYQDLNGNGRRDPGEPGLANVPVTDGVQFVITGPDGSYEISPATDPVLVLGGTPAISVSFPQGYWPSTPWFVDLDKMKPGESVEFGLQSRKEELPFLFIHGTDAHVPRAGKIKFQNFRNDLDALKDQLAFGILTGDLTEASDSHSYDQAREEYGFLGEQLHNFPIPLFCLPGNHDLSGVNATPAWDTNILKGHQFFTHVVGPLRWSFNYADIHFVGIDFMHPLTNKWGWGTPANSVQWLDRDLQLVPSGRRIFLFVHDAIDTNGLSQVVRRHPVTQIFHGHDHQDLANTFAGVPSLSGGSISQVFEDKDRPAGYRVVRVTKEGFESFYRPSGEPHGITLNEPRTASAFRAGQTLRGAVWDPQHALKKLWLKNGAALQEVAMDTGSLWRRFQTEITPALTNGVITNFTISVTDGSLTWKTAPFQSGATALHLFSFEQPMDRVNLVETDAKAQFVQPGTVRVAIGHRERWPGVTLKIPGAPCDLSPYLSVTIPVTNLDAKDITVFGRLDNAGADGTKNCLTTSIDLKVGAAGELRWLLNPTPWRLADGTNLVGMRAAPGKSENFDSAKVTQVLIFTHEPKADCVIQIGAVTVAGRVWNLPGTNFFPFIDEFGQFIHADWSGKTKSVEDLTGQIRIEGKDMKDHAAPTDWDEYGGWSEGPKLKATGFFRTEKREGKWWLVTPSGHLFWSMGMDCVDGGSPTPISEREYYFRYLPKSGDSLSRYYGTGSWAPMGFYEKHLPYKTYDFARANLERKFGESWRQSNAEMAHRRLRSWGMNTIGNWSDTDISHLSRTPYTATLSIGARVIEGSEGYWGKFADVFDPSFRESIRKNMEHQASTAAKDPWCIGFFVDNELAWGNETSLAEGALMSPPTQPAKLAFLADLKAKYGNIEKLNEAWGTHHATWDALLESREKPNPEKAKADLETFYTKLAETYFQTVREEVKRVAPNHLYLSCRFAWINDRALRAAAKYSEVLSCNVYEYNVDSVRPPADIDLPFIIGEFHFGALDRGMFHTGLKSARDQEDRANKFTNYVHSALKHPLIVGAHWFQYRDEPTTGRGDGENYQIGFVDICDRPYPEIVRASRAIGENLYDTRSGGAAR